MFILHPLDLCLLKWQLINYLKYWANDYILKISVLQIKPGWLPKWQRDKQQKNTGF